MTVRDILNHKCNREIISVSPDLSVYDAIKLMAKQGIGAVLIVQEDVLVGIMTERDYARRIILEGRSSRDTPVKTIMSAPLYYVHPEATVSQCRKLMTDFFIRYLPVIENGKLIGIVSSGDIVAFMIEEKDFLISQLTNYITGTHVRHVYNDQAS